MISTHPKKADANTQREEEEVSNEESAHPYDGEFPRNEFIVSIRSCK